MAKNERNKTKIIEIIKSRKTLEYLTQRLASINEVQPYWLRNVSDFRLHKATNNAMKGCLL